MCTINLCMAGHELGPDSVAAVDSRPPVPAMACQSAVGCRTAPRSPDLSSADQPPRGTVEGKPQRKTRGPGKTRCRWGATTGMDRFRLKITLFVRLVEGSRPRGRPMKTWKEVVREDCQARKLNKEDAMDRCKRRKLIKEARWSGWVWVGECFFWYWLTRVVPDQRPLNGRCCCLLLSIHLKELVTYSQHMCHPLSHIDICLHKLGNRKK